MFVEVIVPCHNEEASAHALTQAINAAISSFAQPGDFTISFGVIIVNDGSLDQTAELFAKLLSESTAIQKASIVSLSRNFGKEAAILAGLKQSQGDACIILDADLQDPPSLIPLMTTTWLDGYEVVNAVRNDRSSDRWMKRFSSESFYSIFLRLSRLKAQYNASDCRLLGRAAINAIVACDERVRFSKGFFAWIGFEQKNVYYSRQARNAGSSKWGSWRLWNYALDGIFNFSTAPLRIWSYIGITVTLGAFIAGLIAALRVLFWGIDVPGYASLFFAVTFLGGLQLIGIGIIGEYIGRSFIESKRRPHYIIKDVHIAKP